MVWVVAWLSRVFAVAWSVRHTLKTLKKVSRTDCETLNDYKVRSSACADALIFWVVFAFIVVWEQYFELLTRWIPGYYYCKAIILLLIAFPKIRINNFVFNHVIVPALEIFYTCLGSRAIPSALTIVRLVPLVGIAIFFPNVIYHNIESYDDEEIPNVQSNTSISSRFNVCTPALTSGALEASMLGVIEEEELWEPNYSSDPFAPLQEPEQETVDEATPYLRNDDILIRAEQPDAAPSLTRFPEGDEAKLRSSSEEQPLAGHRTPKTPPRTPDKRPSPANQAMLSNSARRLSYLVEMYPGVNFGHSAQRVHPVGDENSCFEAAGADPASSERASTLQRASQMSPTLPKLNTRSSRQSVFNNIELNNSTVSPMHREDCRESQKVDHRLLSDDSMPTKAKKSFANELRGKFSHHAIADPVAAVPVSRYVDMAYSKVAKEDVVSSSIPASNSVISSMRSFWTGDVNMSIRESLRTALDVRTPPTNTVARRRASALQHSQEVDRDPPTAGLAAAVVAAAQRSQTKTSRRPNESRVSGFGATSKQMSTARSIKQQTKTTFEKSTLSFFSASNNELSGLPCINKNGPVVVEGNNSDNCGQLASLRRSFNRVNKSNNSNNSNTGGV